MLKAAAWFFILSAIAYVLWAFILWKGTDAQKAFWSAFFVVSPIPPVP